MIKEGDTLPIVTWDMYTCDSKNVGGFFGKKAKRSWKKLNSNDLFEKRSLVVGIPGAWTDTCTMQMQHLEGHFDAIYTKDIEDIYVLSVDNSFVMQSWLWGMYSIKLKFIADGNAEFGKKIGMLVDKSNMGYGENRYWRFAMVVEHNKVEKLFIEPGKADNVDFDYDPWIESHTPKILKYLHSTGRRQDPPDESRWFANVPFPEVDTSQFGTPIERDVDYEAAQAKADEDWIAFHEANADVQDFNPETDSIYHKEMEEEAKRKKDDEEMESNMLGS